jgi:hypothetical protein
MSRSIAPAARLTFLAVAIGLSTSMIGVAAGVMTPGLSNAASTPAARIAPPETVSVLHGFKLHPIGRVNWT